MSLRSTYLDDVCRVRNRQGYAEVVVSGPLVSPQMRGCERLQDAASGGPPLSIGSRGEAVRILQSALHRFGYRVPNSMRTGEPDGDYRAEVSNAVREFQRRNRLDLDGRAGPQVLMRLDEMLVAQSRQSRLPPLPADLRRAQVVRRDNTAVATARRLPPPRDPRVRPDAGDRQLQGRNQAVLPLEYQSVPINPVVAEVYAQAGEYITDLVRTTQRALADLGCGRDSDRRRFGVQIRRVFDTIVGSDDHDGPLDALSVRDARAKRRSMLEQVVQSLGGTQRQASQLADRELGAYQARGPYSRRMSDYTLMTMFFNSARSLYDRLGELRREVDRRYAGTDNDPQPGIEQTLGLLARFPDVAPDIYAAAGLRNLAGVPPQIQGPTNLRAQAFVHAGSRWDAQRRREDTLQAAGLVIVGLAIGIVSFGTLSAVSAMLVTAGFTVATGAANILDGSAQHRQTGDAYAMGAASPETLELSEARLQGAHRALFIDVLTMGVTARLGGAQNLSRVARLVRVQGVGIAGSALSMASDPDVMRAPNTAGIILFGVAVSMVADVGVDATAARFAGRGGRLRPVQISVVKLEGSIRVGSRVRVASGSDEPAVEGVVRAIDASSGVVTVVFSDGSSAQVRVDRVGRVDTSPSSTPLTAEGVEAFGMDAALAQTLRRYASEQDIIVYLRGGSPASMRQRTQNGAHPKPMDMKAKSISEDDVAIGIGTPDDVGLIGHALPKVRPGTAGWAALTPGQRERALARIEQFHERDAAMRALTTSGGLLRIGPNQKRPYRIQIDEHGVVRDMQGVAFAGDIDVFTITGADGSPLDRAGRVQHTRALMRMSDLSIQHHGFTPDWQPSSAADREAQAAMMHKYGPGGSGELLIIGSGGVTTGSFPGN